jgi:hypothetical protein
MLRRDAFSHVSSGRVVVDDGGRLRKPMFLHERNAQDDLFAILGEFAGRLPPVVCHCFTGSAPGTRVVRCRAITAATISFPNTFVIVHFSCTQISFFWVDYQRYFNIFRRNYEKKISHIIY